MVATLYVNGQAKAINDSLRKICNGPVFTLLEVMPYPSHGSDAYADTLKKYLSAQKKVIVPGNVTLRLIIFANAEVKFIEVEKSTIPNTDELVKAIENITNQWTPGTQNKRLVCCYRRMHIKVSKSNIKVKVPDRL